MVPSTLTLGYRLGCCFSHKSNQAYENIPVTQVFNLKFAFDWTQIIYYQLGWLLSYRIWQKKWSVISKERHLSSECGRDATQIEIINIINKHDKTLNQHIDNSLSKTLNQYLLCWLFVYPNCVRRNPKAFKIKSFLRKNINS